jgi:small subunit ribosomal protein S19
MTRSIWKGPYVNSSLTHKITKKQKVKSWSRQSMIIPEFIGTQLDVYNGKKFITVSITEEMVGHKLGEFAPTRKTAIHKKK